tara:strand:- start:2240 stop:4180 length:1941 start_codon:yes stop_codon:yes gene_type:complete
MFDHGVGIRNPLFFVGVIENNVDARLEGRVQVRAFSVHGSVDQVPTDMLPWAIVVQGGYDPNVVPKINSWVYGMFLDGRDAQQPMVLGLIPTQFTDPLNPTKTGWGIVPDKDGDILAQGSAPKDSGQPQNSRLARGEYIEETHVLAQEMGRTVDVPIGGTDESWDEPAPAYNAQYPHNRVIETATHSIELDDTPGAERIMIHHKSGSFIQIDSRGTTTTKSVSDKYDVMDRKQHVVVGGMSTVTILGNSYVYVKGNKVEEIEGDLQTLVHGNHMLSVGGQSTINASDQVQIRAADVKINANVGTMSFNAAKELQVESGKGTYFKSKKVWIQATDTLNIFGDKINMQGVTDFNIKGDTILKLGSNGLLHLDAATVNIDDFVSMANGTAVAPDDAEESVGADKVVAPEPVGKSTSIVSLDIPGSIGSAGVSSRDHGGDGTSSSAATISSINAATQTAATPLLNFIGNKESEGYDDISGLVSQSRYPVKSLTQMTITEVLDWQESIDRFQLSEASGRYQIMEDTLRGYNNDTTTGPGSPLYTKAGISGGDLFSPKNQDKMAIVLLEQRGLNRFLSGEITREEFANNLASEWASLPLVTGPNAGKSQYSGDRAGNKSLTTVQEFLNAIDAVKSTYSAPPGDPTNTTEGPQ